MPTARCGHFRVGHDPLDISRELRVARALRVALAVRNRPLMSFQR